MSWFEVDRKGLRQLLEDKERSAILFELLQNCWDERPTKVTVTLEKVPRRPLAKLVVTDDSPEGFRDLCHAFTLFAPTYKRIDPTKRGRFNLGEKLVLALCEEATIETTTGCVEFAADGLRHRRRRKTKAGSVFTGLVRMNQAQYDEVCVAVSKLVPPVDTWFNGELLAPRTPVKTFTATLPTIVANTEGVMTRTRRQTEVRLYEPGREEACIYEMGIPIVATGDRWHIDVQQRVPQNLNRDNVSPAYLAQLRALVLNHACGLLKETEVQEDWVTEAMGHKDAESPAVANVFTKRYGEQAVIYDPSDSEANHRATGKGYTVVHGGAGSQEWWSNVKESGVVQPAGQVFPTPQPYAEEGKPVKVVPESEWNKDIHRVADLAKWLALELMDVDLIVRVVDTKNSFGACYKRRTGSNELHFNLKQLGHSWFQTEGNKLHGVLDLLLHEFGHHYASSHLSDGYHTALSRLGADLALLVLLKPEKLQQILEESGCEDE